MKTRILELVIGLCALTPALSSAAQPAATSTDSMDRDLLEVTIPQLHRYYDQHRYTVSQVVDWYLARIARYNGVYQPVEQVFDAEARTAAKREDSEPAAAHGPLWGVPIVIKANTSIEGTPHRGPCAAPAAASSRAAAARASASNTCSTG